MPTARTYFEAFGKDADKEIYQAVTSVWYALDFYRRFFKESGNKRPKTPKERRTNFLHSVFVYKGTLVVADRLEDHYQLSEEPHVMLRTIDCKDHRLLNEQKPSFRLRWRNNHRCSTRGLPRGVSIVLSRGCARMRRPPKRSGEC